MGLKTQYVNATSVPQGVSPVVYVSQYDVGRKIVVRFPQDLLSSGPQSVKVNGRKADGHTFLYTESDKWSSTGYVIQKTVDQSGLLEVTVCTTEQMTACPGETLLQVIIEESTGGAVIGTINIVMYVQEQPYANGDPSQSDIPAVTRTVCNVSEPV